MRNATPPANTGRAPAGPARGRTVIAVTALACAGLAAVTGCSAASSSATGLVTHVVWTSWGGTRAVAAGVSDYVGPGQSVATGTEEPVTVVAFDLGTCHGKLMYRAVEWYFPQHGQAFDAGRYENICTGSYVPGS